MDITQDMRRQLLRFQQNEITEHHIYRRLAQTAPSVFNREILERIAHEEHKHSLQWRNYYISVARDVPFKSRFLEMAGLSLGVAAFSFLIGFILRAGLGVEV